MAVVSNISGFIVTGGLAQVLSGVNPGRSGMWIRNEDPMQDLWINDLGSAAATQPSILISAGGIFEFPSGGTPQTAISIFGAVSNQVFTAREW